MTTTSALPSWWWVHLFALFNLAATLPLYQLLGRAEHAPFFVARQSTIWDLIALVLTFSAAAPASLCVLTWLSGLVWKPLQRWFYALLCFLLLSVAVLPIVGELLAAHWPLALACSFLLAGILTILYFAAQRVRWFVSILGIGVIAAPIWLFASPTVQSLRAQPSVPISEIFTTASEKPNIVMIVFDELPLASLMDGNREIDVVRFPNFARLASTSTWYRNTTATHYSTMMAMTALMVGDDRDSYLENVFGSDKPPSGPVDEIRIPRNLFTLLKDEYSIAATELVTRLAPARRDEGTYVTPFTSRVLELLQDSSVLLAYHVSPKPLQASLPSIEGQWRGFGSSPQSPLEAEDWPYVDSFKRLSVVRQFIDSLHKTNRPTLYFLHTLLPHFPFEYDDEGRFHANRLRFLTMHFREATGTNDWPDRTSAEIAYQAHLLQLAFTDTLLGRILDRLVDEGLFDDSIILVVADHGTSYFWASGNLSAERLAEIQAAGSAYVPWLLKLPGQSDARVSDKPMQTIDILPTLAELAGFRVPWKIGGLSAFGDIPPDRERFIYLPRKLEFESLDRGLEQALQYKLDRFGSNSKLGLEFNGPLPSLQGRHVSDFNVRPLSGTVKLENGRLFEAGAFSDTNYPAYIKGSIVGMPTPPIGAEADFAVAVNGIIRATGRTTDFDISALSAKERNESWDLRPDSGHSTGGGPGRSKVYFMAYIPRAVLDPAGNSVRVYGVVPPVEGSGLQLLEFPSAERQ